MSAVWDGFMFFNELDLLKRRLEHTKNHVTGWVLVESTHTHQGNPKPLHFAENRGLFKDFLPRIRYAVYDSKFQDSWASETDQRTLIGSHLSDLPNDVVVVVSDLDEFPSHSFLIRKPKPNEVLLARQKVHYYWTNLNIASGDEWTGTRSTTFGNLKRVGGSGALRYTGGGVNVEDGGDHYSFMGGPDRVIDKVKAFAHTEYNFPEFIDLKWVNAAVFGGLDLFRRNDEKQAGYWRWGPKTGWMDRDAHFSEYWTPDACLARLFDLCRDTGAVKGVAVEFGAWEGRSAVILSHAVDDDLVVCDHWKGNVSEGLTHLTCQLIAAGRNVEATFHRNMKSLTRGNIKVVSRDAVETADSLGAIRFAYLDAGHDYDSTKALIVAVMKKLTTPGGVICGDDYGHGEIQRAIKDTLGWCSSDGNLWWRKL